MELNDFELLELKSQIGITEEATDKSLLKIKTLQGSLKLLPIYNLLLLERLEETIPLIVSCLKNNLDLEYLSSLQQSKYYIQRKSVPMILKYLNFDEKNKFLMKSLSDPICDVIKEAVLCIKENNSFNQEELTKIAIELFNSKYTAVKLMAIDILTLIEENSFFIMDLLKINNWRIRLKLSSCLDYLKKEDQDRIINEIKGDIVEEVRIELSKHLKSLDYIELLKDPSESVRANYLKNVINLIEDENILKKMIDDESWEVKKILLHLKGDLFKKITIPLIKNNDDSSWRVKMEILQLVENNIKNEYVTKLMVNFLLKCLKNKVFEIRKKAQEILILIINNYKWVDEYYYEIEEICFSQNYLFRITMFPVVYEYDSKYGTELSKKFENDPVVNVRDFYKDYLKQKNGNCSVLFSDKIDESFY